MSNEEKGKKPRKEKKGRSKTALLLLVAGFALAFIIQSTIILLLMGMIPTIVAFIVDTGKQKSLARTVFMCNLSGVLPYVSELVATGNNMRMFMQYFTDPKVWFFMYAAAGVGWLLYKGSHNLVAFWYQVSHQAKIAHIESVQRQLIREWGPELRRK